MKYSRFCGLKLNIIINSKELRVMIKSILIDESWGYERD